MFAVLSLILTYFTIYSPPLGGAGGGSLGRGMSAVLFLITCYLFAFLSTPLPHREGQGEGLLPPYFFVTRNQSTSTQPPSLVTMWGRVQKVPILAPIHWPSRTRKGWPSFLNFLPSVL